MKEIPLKLIGPSKSSQKYLNLVQFYNRNPLKVVAFNLYEKIL